MKLGAREVAALISDTHLKFILDIFLNFFFNFTYLGVIRRETDLTFPIPRPHFEMILIDLEEYIQLHLISRIDLSPLNDCTWQHILENAKNFYSGH